MKILARMLALSLMLVCLASAPALALVEPQSKNLEQTLSYDYDTLKIQIDQWHYAYKNHDVRFFVVNLHLTDPAQMQTAFAGETYSKRNVEAPSDIAARHNSVLAINGDYYNYKDNNKMIVYSSEEVLLDTKGEQFPIPVDYELNGYSDGILLLEKDGVFGFMDTTGAWIAEPIYTYAEAFYEGLAVLKTADGRYGLIDTNGNIVLPFGYEHISSCSDGVVVAYSDENGWEIFKKMTK